jgi:uncharacterized protein YqjF (DUF2071 family)
VVYRFLSALPKLICGRILFDMSKKFLSAEWRKLILANYPVEKAALQPYLPINAELDEWNGKTYVSLVGFMFLNTKMLGIKIPFHVNFPEVNLRFYVRVKEKNNWKRGVVFIKEIVPKPAITFVANVFFNEHYATMPMKNHHLIDNNQLTVGYEWKYNHQWNKLGVVAESFSKLIAEGSKEEFITQHFWGYSSTKKKETIEYEVTHPKWESYPVKSYTINCDFGRIYGTSFDYLSQTHPESVMLAEGSEIAVFNKRVIDL